MKHILSLVLFAICISASSQTFMNVYQNNGTVNQINIAQIDSITYRTTPPPATMNIHQSGGALLQIPINNIDSITYTISNSGNIATISTSFVTNITGSEARSGGGINNTGGTPVTHKGVVWSTSSNPTTANYKTTNGSGTGSYTSNLNNLLASTTYYVRAYATNSAGTAYGNERTFTTNPDGTITALSCNNASHTGSLTIGVPATGVSSKIPYNVGNGGTYSNQNISSTGVIGLTASITAGSFSIGDDSITLVISGTPSTSGIARFSLNIGGVSCSFSRMVGSGIISNPGSGVTFDGYTYKSIQLGNGQEWMAENLRTTRYANGDIIPNIKDDLLWQSLTSGAWVHYANDTQYENPYGKLYNGYTIQDPRGVCPIGWHLPSFTEFELLGDYLGGELVAGDKMKVMGTQYWFQPNQNATNESGFSAVGAGQRCGWPSVSSFTERRIIASWWRTLIGTGSYGTFRLSEGNSNLVDYGTRVLCGHSIRCIKD